MCVCADVPDRYTLQRILSVSDQLYVQATRRFGKMVPEIQIRLCRRIKEHVQGRLTTHTQEVCGLMWSPSGTQLASGGNDNLLAIWQAGAMQPLHQLTEHRAAVKVTRCTRT